MYFNSLVEAFPYDKPRQIQREALEHLEAIWNDYDVFVIVAPTAFGKSAVSKAIANWRYKVSTITPANMLVGQYLDEFPDTKSLHRMDSYGCDLWKRSCIETKRKLGGFCQGCDCSRDLAQAKYKKGPGIYNYHTYMAHGIYREVLVVDEAHNLISVIQDRLSTTLWQHDLKYPLNMYGNWKIARWIESLPERQRKGKKLTQLYQAVTDRAPKYVVTRTSDWFNGKGTNRGEPELRDCIKLYPVDISDAPPFFWPREVEKIVLMSATIGQKDIEALGLNHRKRVAYLSCDSPIPGGNRPIIPVNLVGVNRNNMEIAIKQIAQYLQEVLEPRHLGEKGVIHVTYQMAEELRNHLTGDRYMFHNRGDKAEVYQRFRESTAESGRILVACGMYEGLDLPDDLGRWQVVAKVPWKSLGDPAIAYKTERDPEWYAWETWKTVIQACGRICRTPTDFGISYILDSSFMRLYKEHGHMMPEWYREAIVWNTEETAKVF